MFELEAPAELLLMSTQAKASIDTQPQETRIEVLLVRAVLSGDREGFGQLYDLFAPMVHDRIHG